MSIFRWLLPNIKCWVCHFVFEPELMSVSKPGIVPLLLSSRPDIHNSQTTKMKKSTQGKIWKRAVIGIFNNIIPPFQRQNKTRLTYNCAHLRLNNKKNKNELSQKGPRDWALIFEKSDLTNFLAIPEFLGWKFSVRRHFVPRTNCPNVVFRETNCPIRQNVPLSPQRQIVPSDKLSHFLPGDKMSHWCTHKKPLFNWHF